MNLWQQYWSTERFPVPVKNGFEPLRMALSHLTIFNDIIFTMYTQIFSNFPGMTTFSTTKLFLMLRRTQHIQLLITYCVLDNQINVSESSNQPKSGKKNYTIEPASPGNTYIRNLKGKKQWQTTTSYMVQYRILLHRGRLHWLGKQNLQSSTICRS